MKILIVDDQKLFSDILKKTLENNNEYDFIVTVANNHENVMPLLAENNFDIILMDIHMPGKDGITITKEITRKYPSSKILILTAFGYDDYVKSALKAGAVGFLLKDITSEELTGSIIGASKGTRILSPSVFNYTDNQINTEMENEEIPEWYSRLSHRHRELLTLVMQGYSNEEIAETLHLSMQTVKNYLSIIYSTLNVKNRFQAMRLAMKYKIDQVKII
jgi:DNA-binding NarL/FixJ family response regulator